MNQIVTRRTFGTLAMMVLVGCADNDEEQNQDNQEQNQSDPEFEAETDPKGTITVSDQKGQGHEITIGNAGANVDYRIIVEYSGHTIESDIISANQEVSPVIESEAQIRSTQTVQVSIVSVDGERLASSSFQYIPVPPGPEMSVGNVEGIIRNTNTHGLFEELHNEPTLESDVDGYVITVDWLHDYADIIPFLENKEDKTKRNVAVTNARFFNRFYNSDFVIQEVEINTFQLRGYESTGEPVIEPSGEVLVTRSTAEQISWDNLLQEGEFPEGLRQIADEYSFTYHEPLE